MFPLVENGPVIPTNILNAWQEDKIIFLCGAGISYYSDLPGFADLAEDVFLDLSNGPKLAHEAEAANDRHWDTFLGHLEKRFGPDKVRKSIAKRLLIKSPCELDFHKALLTLARTADGGTRLVTTNFDRRFFECSGHDFQYCTAPLLPVPKRARWNSVVFLHGLLHDDELADNSDIVFSASDFGAAYLTEGWGTRFITELFREFTVVFVGYSLADPVVFYLVSALASESKARGIFKGAYAFAAYDGSVLDDKNIQESRWTNKGVTPILFDSANNYSLLKDTFIEWSKQSKNGMLSREHIFRETSERKPNELLDSEPIANRLIWSLYDDNGYNSRKFAAQSTIPALEWFLDVIDKIPFSHPSFNGKQIKLCEISAWRKTDATQDLLPVPTSFAQEQDDFSEHTKLHPVARNLMAWLSRHIYDKRLLEWFLKRGCQLHPEAKELIQLQLRNRRIEQLSPEQAMIHKIWKILTGTVCDLPRQGYEEQLFDITGTRYSLNTIEWLNILEQFEPVLKLKPGFSWLQSEQISFRDYASPSVVLPVSEFGYNLVAQIGKLNNADLLLASSADEITSKLKRAVDLFAIAEEANQHSDPSYLDRPSISEHEQNENASPWTALIELAKMAFDAQVKTSTEDAYAMFNRWSKINYPIFKRLCLYACTEHEVIDANLGIQILLENNTLWNNTSKREVLRYLRVAAVRLSQESMATLEQQILIGPKLPLANERFSNEQIAEFRIGDTLLRLHKLATNPAVRLAEQSQSFIKIHSKAPSVNGEEDEFPIWFTEHISQGTQPPIARFDKQSTEEIIRILTAQPESAAESCYQLLCDQPEKFFQIMDTSSKSLFLLPGFYRSMMRGFSSQINKNEDISVTNKILAQISSITDEIILQQIDSISEVVDALSKNQSRVDREQFLCLWDRVMHLSIKTEDTQSNIQIVTALNHPVGILTNSLLRWLGKVDKHSTFPEYITTRLNEILEATSHSALYGQMMMALSLCFLHFGDAEWTNKKLLPLLNWTKLNAKVLWKSYLYSNQWYPDLFTDAKSDFIDCFRNQQDLGSESKNLVELWVMAKCSRSNIFDQSETADICQNLSEENLVIAATRLKKTLEQSMGQKTAVWTESISPCLREIWPNELSRQTELTSKALAALAIEADDMFGDAVAMVEQHFVKCSNIAQILHLLEKKKLALSHPQACLLLVYRLIDQTRVVSVSLGGLKQILTDLSFACPEIITSPQYRQLETLVSTHT